MGDCPPYLYWPSYQLCLTHDERGLCSPYREGEPMKPSADVLPRTSRRFGRRWLRPTLVCLGIWVALAAIFYAEEDWRGQRDWNRYRQAAEARGESLDFHAYVPKPVPDAENFAATPIVKSWFRPGGSDPLTNDLYARAANNIPETKIMWDKAPRHFTDLWHGSWRSMRSRRAS